MIAEEKSIVDELFTWRRLSGMGWRSKAENARFNAIALSRMASDPRMVALADELRTEEAHTVALEEGFLREAAIALELIIKAVISQSLQLQLVDPALVGLPTTHDLPSLWKAAELPALSARDAYRLYYFKTVLIWAGRYPTPKNSKDWQSEREVLNSLKRAALIEDDNNICAPLDVEVLAFNRLFEIVDLKFHQNRSRMPKDFWLD